ATEESFTTVRVDVAELDLVLDGLAEASVHASAVTAHLSAIDDARALATALYDHLDERHAPGRSTSDRDRVRARASAEQLRSLLESIGAAGASSARALDAEVRGARERTAS